MFELNKRVKYIPNGAIIKTAKDVYDYCWPKMQDLDREQFRVLLLDSEHIQKTPLICLTSEVRNAETADVRAPPK